MQADQLNKYDGFVLIILFQTIKRMYFVNQFLYKQCKTLLALYEEKVEIIQLNVRYL